MKTRAAVAFGAKAPLSIETLDIRAPRSGEALVRMVAAALCHTDLAVLDGEKSGLGAFPIVLGHEGAGIVEAIGPDVELVAPSDHVVLAAIPECGVCGPCRAGTTNQCEWSFTLRSKYPTPLSRDGAPVDTFLHLGAFSQYMVVPAIGVAKVNRSIPLNRACLTSCSVATGAGTVLFLQQVRPGASVVVFGMGAIGLNAVQAARIAGAAIIIAVDVNPAKEASARAFGATHFLNPRTLTGGVVEEIRALTNGGADYTIEATGSPVAALDAVRASHAGWGSCALVGVLPDGTALPFTDEELGRGRIIRFSMAGNTRGRSDTPRFSEMYLEGTLMLDELVSTTVTLDAINEVVDGLREGSIIRGVVEF